MGKLLLFVFGILLAWWFVKNLAKSARREDVKPPAASEDMVRCAQCGVHLPRSESCTSSGEFFCSEEHLRLHR